MRFNERMGTLEKQADFKNLVDAPLVHSCLKSEFQDGRIYLWMKLSHIG
jgi:hypothetical protein